MARSIKKGPYVAPDLLKKAERAQATNDKKVIKTRRAVRRLFPSFSD